MSKIATITTLVVVVILVLFAVGHSSDISKYGGKEVAIEKYYTYGISTETINKHIEPGEIFTNVKVTFVNITNVAENPDDVLAVYLLDNPPLGMISNIDGDPSSDFFDFNPETYSQIKRGETVQIPQRNFTPLSPAYKDTTPGTENLVYNLIDIDDSESWVWDIYNKPFDFRVDSNDPNNTVAFSSTVLEFIDYAGNNTPVGFGFDPMGTDGFTFDEIIVELTIEQYEGTYEKRIVPIRFTKPPMIVQ